MPAAKVTSVVEDLSTRVNSTSTYNTAIVVAAPKGPINKPVKISSQTSFLRTYTPYERLEIGWDQALYEAYRYLEDQNGLYVVRAANTDDTTGVKTGCVLVPFEGEFGYLEPENSEDDSVAGLTFTQFETLENSEGDVELPDTDNYAFIIYASSPGKFANDLRIQIITDRNIVGVDGAFIINVLLKDITKETFTCSLSRTIKDGYGSSCYIKDVLEASQYIRAAILDSSNFTEKVREVVLTINDNEDQKLSLYTNNENLTEFENKNLSQLTTMQLLQYRDSDGKLKDYTAQDEEKVTKNRLYLKGVYTNANCTEGSEYVIIFKPSGADNTNTYKLDILKSESSLVKLPISGKADLKGADDGEGTVSEGQRITALNALSNMHDLTFQLVLDGGLTNEAYHRAIKKLTDKRKNSCHGIICTDIVDERSSDAITALTNYRKYELNMNSYSMEMYTPHQKYYDEFNDRYMWLSPGPFVAAKIMQTAQERGWHWAVAGYNRGVVDSIDVARAFEEGEVDELSDMQINTIIKDPGSGNVIWDELTMLNQASDLQDAHISRWINIYLRPALEEMLKSFLFEFNDEETRNLIVKKIETFMEPQKSARACYAYRVICNEQNNTDSDIENNRLNCWLYVKPMKISKWITQKVIITPYSTQLEDLEF